MSQNLVFQSTAQKGNEAEDLLLPVSQGLQGGLVHVHQSVAMAVHSWFAQLPCGTICSDARRHVCGLQQN